LDSDEPRLFEVEAPIEEAPPTSYEIRVQPVTDQQALVMSRDITIRRAEETKQRDYDEAMRQRQKLESLGVLTGGIAHDFNNLLAVILGYTDLMLRSKKLDSAQVLQAERIKGAAEQASDLTDQMLAYAGRQPIQTSRVQLSELVKGMSDLLGSAVGSRARLEYHFSPNLPPIQASPSQMSQVLLNFVTNAAEACEQKGGCIRVTTLVTELTTAYLSECESLEPLPGGTHVILEVTDDGEGMDESVRLRMFEPFFTTKFTGRGMGLPSVVGIVHSHGGAIHVASTEGGGCTIRAIFPIATQRASGDAVDTSRSCSQDVGRAIGGRVLVVDDDENVRSVAVQMLKRMGLEVLEASGGKEAVSMFKKRTQDFSLILLDLTMPEMDGTAVLQAIHGENPETPIILCSGYAQADFFGRFTGNPKVGALQKPFTYAELQESVQKALLS
jgi:signal transduction histidine kinase/CheY-like chemotaxis protein